MRLLNSKNWKKNMAHPWGIKYRPRKVEHIIGNDAVISKLVSDMKAGQVSSRLLITGETGSGKTSISYLLAEYFTGESYDPNVPSLCVAEVNAASEGGIDTVRELIDRTRYAPMSGKHHVIIVDEAQSLTPAAMKALYKPLEAEGDAIWMLLTNEPGKLSATIRGRLNHVRMEYPNADALYMLAEDVYESEKIKTFPKKAIDYMCERAGNVRLFLNALQDLHQRGKVTEKAAEEALFNALEGEEKDALENLLSALEYDLGGVQAVNVMVIYNTWADLLCHAIARGNNMSGKAAEQTYFRNLFYSKWMAKKISAPRTLDLLHRLNQARTSVIQGGVDSTAAFICMFAKTEK
jgi:DNA polymerase III gamma/tau subunit